MIENLSIIIDHFKPQILFVFFFRFIRCVFCIVYLDPIHFLSLCMYPLPLHTTPQIKQNSREKKKEKKMKKKFLKGRITNLIMEPAAWPNKSHCIALCPYISTCKCSLQRVIDLVQGHCLYHMIDTGPPLGLF